ncbi:hypothetical protein ACOMHN_059320 [Nucella lapillus]
MTNDTTDSPENTSISSENEERNWHGCREDISPSEPIPGVSIKEMLPSLYAQMLDQIVPSYRDPARVMANVSAEQNLQQLREWYPPMNRIRSSNSRMKISMTPASSMVKGIMSLRKKVP